MKKFLVLFGCVFISHVGLGASLQKVWFKTTDNLILKASYRPSEEDTRYFIMLHGLASVKEEWAPLIDSFQDQDWGVLAYDARGHGDSSETRDPSGNPDGYKLFGRPGRGSQWEKMINDVGAAKRFLTKEEQVNPKSIYLVGASLGANVALNYAALTTSIKGVILLSPGLEYAGVTTEKPIQKVHSRVLIIVSPQDKYAYQSSLLLKKMNPSIDLWTDVKAGHGVQMLDEALMKRIKKWIDQ